jgi:hypothetical protein
MNDSRGCASIKLKNIDFCTNTYVQNKRDESCLGLLQGLLGSQLDSTDSYSAHQSSLGAEMFTATVFTDENTEHRKQLDILIVVPLAGGLTG